MKFTIATAKIHAMLSRAAKGVGNNKILPITSYLELALDEDKQLSIVSTDGANFLTVVEQKVDGEPGIAVVEADKLVKLVAKTTKANITIELKEAHLEVKGNGTYKLPLNTETFPGYEFTTSADPTVVDTVVLQRMFEVNESAIAKDMLMPCLTGYNVGEKCITTDGVRMSINGTVVFGGEPVLMTQSMAVLVGQFKADKVTIDRDGNKLLLSTEDMLLYGPELDGLDQYPDVTGLLSVDYPNEVTVGRAEFVAVLDRLSLFVDPFDNNAVRISFGETMQVEDIKANSLESLNFLDKESKRTEAMVALVFNIKFLADLLAVLTGDKVTLKYGEGLPLSLVDGNVTQVVSTMEVS